MTWEWVVVVVLVIGFWSVVNALGAIERQVAPSADAMIDVKDTLHQIETRMSSLESDLAQIRKSVAPRLWE